MNNRRRRNNRQQQSRVWSWISFVLFTLVITLLGFSVIKKQSPAKTLKKLFITEKVEDDLSTYNKKDLLARAQEQQKELETLRLQLEQCKDEDGLQKAVINTSSTTLNMRSEASLESDILLKIPNGSRVSIMYYDDRELFLEGAVGRWCHIRYAEQEGWVWGNYLQTIK